MKFDVNIRSMKQTSDDIEAVADTLMDFYEELNSITLDGCFSGAILLALNNPLNYSRNNLLGVSVKTHNIGAQLNNILNRYENTERKLMRTEDGLDSWMAEVGDDNYDGHSGIYDAWGGYGGDQGDLAHNKSGFRFFFWRFSADNDLINFSRQY